MILAGDIGGTKTHLGLFDPSAPSQPVRERKYPSADYPSLLAIVRDFMSGAGRVEAAAFGVAGPVQGERVQATNLPWLVDRGAIAPALEGAPVLLLNDVEALGYGLDALAPDDLVTLNPGAPRPGNRAVIAAGTGLGQAVLAWNGRHHVPLATEGGHSDMAPRNDLEVDLLRYLARDYGHVSWERVLSGPGLHNLYRFLRDTGRGVESPGLAERLRAEDPAAVISDSALAGESRLCEDALDLFCTLYGAEAGNVALESLAVNGVFVGGGIAPRILPRLRAGGFIKAFRDKGRMAALLDQIPVRVVLRPEAALWGAARHAARAVIGEDS